jgi:hypothetical protein
MCSFTLDIHVHVNSLFFLSPGSKKPAPIPPKVPAGYGQSGGSGGISDQSTGQPSPVSLSPTPPSTPSPYGLAGPPQAPGGLGASSPGQTPLCGSLGSLGSLSSPPSLTGTLGKSRPTPKPRQRPSLPPPQPPTVPQPGATPVGPGPLEQGILDGLSPGESMSTGKQHDDHVTTATTPPLPPQVGSGTMQPRPALRLAVALSNGDGGQV